jgi:protein SCO1
VHPRLRLTLMLVATIAIAVAASVVLLVRPGAGPDVQASGFAGSLRPDVPTRDFALRDQDGRTVRLSDYRGRPVVMTFLYTVCRDTCPLIADQVRGALDDLGHTPARAARFVARHGLTGRMRYLLGSSAQLQPVWREFGIQPQTGGTAISDHSAYVVLLDRRLRQRVAFPISELTPEDLAHDIRRLEAS